MSEAIRGGRRSGPLFFGGLAVLLAGLAGARWIASWGDALGLFAPPLVATALSLVAVRSEGAMRSEGARGVRVLGVGGAAGIGALAVTALLAPGGVPLALSAAAGVAWSVGGAWAVLERDVRATEQDPGPASLRLALVALLSGTLAYISLASDKLIADGAGAARALVFALTLGALGLGAALLVARRAASAQRSASRRAAQAAAQVRSDLARLRGGVERYREERGWAHGPLALPEAETEAGAEARGAVLRELEALNARARSLSASGGEAQRLKNRLVAFMSHDLRSPLNSIVGFSDVLWRELDGPLSFEQRRSVASIRASAEELLRLVTDIVDTARFEAGRLPFVASAVEVAAALEGALAAAERFARGRGVAFRVEVEPGLPRLYVDPDRLRQAIVGVLGHVLRMAEGGEVVLTARWVRPDVGERDAGDLLGRSAIADRVHVRLVVSARDLPLEDSQRIFIAFREIRRPSGERVAGLGLGLSLARRLVAALGGELRYRSAEGARFTFLLPTNTTLPSAPPMQENPAPVSHREEN